MKAKHTPGNWKAYDWDIDKTRTLRGVGIECGDGFMQGGFEVAVAHGHTSEEAFANAKLIAEAPELLDSLDNIVGFLEYVFDKELELPSHLLESYHNIIINSKEVIKRATE